MAEALRFLSPIHKASRQIGLYLSRHVKETGLQVPEAHLVSYLRSYGPCPIGEIRRVFGLKGSTLTSMLDRLETRGILRRTPSPDDRRSFRVGLTAAGRETAERVARRVEELERRVLAEIADGDLRGFDHVMQAIARVTGVQVRRETR